MLVYADVFLAVLLGMLLADLYYRLKSDKEDK